MSKKVMSFQVPVEMSNEVDAVTVKGKKSEFCRQAIRLKLDTDRNASTQAAVTSQPSEATSEDSIKALLQEKDAEIQAKDAENQAQAAEIDALNEQIEKLLAENMELKQVGKENALLKQGLAVQKQEIESLNAQIEDMDNELTEANRKPDEANKNQTSKEITEMPLAAEFDTNYQEAMTTAAKLFENMKDEPRVREFYVEQRLKEINAIPFPLEAALREAALKGKQLSLFAPTVEPTVEPINKEPVESEFGLYEYQEIIGTEEFAPRTKPFVSPIKSEVKPTGFFRPNGLPQTEHEVSTEPAIVPRRFGYAQPSLQDLVTAEDEPTPVTPVETTIEEAPMNDKQKTAEDYIAWFNALTDEHKATLRSIIERGDYKTPQEIWHAKQVRAGYDVPSLGFLTRATRSMPVL